MQEAAKFGLIFVAMIWACCAAGLAAYFTLHPERAMASHAALGTLAATVLALAVAAFFRRQIAEILQSEEPAPAAVPIDPRTLRRCCTCGNVVVPFFKKAGSGWITLLLLLFYLAPGIIYFVWRRVSGKNTCPACGSSALIPLDSPRP